MGSSRSITSVVVALCAVLTSVLAVAVVLGGRDSAVRPGRGGALRLDFSEAICHDHDARDMPVVTSSEPLEVKGTRLVASTSPALISTAVGSLVSSTETDGPPGKTFESISRSSSRPADRAPPAL